VDYVRDDYFNIANRHVAGFDVSLHWRSRDSGIGRFTLKAEGSFLQRFDDQDLPGDEPVDRVGEYDKPTNRLNGSVEWQNGRWSADVFVAHLPEVDAEDSSGDIVVDGQPLEWRIGSWTTFNASVGYKFSFGALKNTLFRVGGRNIFDTDPPLNPSADGFNSALHSARGRYIYAELRMDF
jgi:outer membrane receptor protein involved in Fe transport